MTRVEFYVLSDDRETSRLELACKLAEKAIRQSEKVHIHTEDPVAASAVDKELWQFRNDSFIPHRLVESDEAAASDPVPVDIGNGPVPADDRTLLINLGSEVPAFFSRFKRTLEIVNQEEDTRASGRVRYTFYRERGYPLKHHKLT